LFVFFKTGIEMDDDIENDYMEVFQLKKKIKTYEQIYHSYSSIDSLKLKIKEQLNLIIPFYKQEFSATTTTELKQSELKSQAINNLKEIYLARIFNDVGILNLSGIDPNVSGEKVQKINLIAIYTALVTYSTNKEIDFSVKQIEKYDNLSALEMLNKHKHLVLLGDPGSGKTTFVNFVSLCLAGEALKDPQVNLKLMTQPLPGKYTSQVWEHKTLVPVRVILRDFVASGFPSNNFERATADHFWKYIESELHRTYLSDYTPYLKQELLTRGGLILFDGLDEIPEADARRVQIIQVVEDVMRVFYLCRILVTSRTYAYQKQAYKINGLKEAILAPFKKEQIALFVDHWYTHIAEIRNLNRNDAKGRAVLLKRAINNSKRLQELAERPLLLTLIASLHAWRGGSLPEQREELYSNAVDLLLDWWERPRIVRDEKGNIILLQPSLMEWLKVDRKRIRGLLNQLAYEAHKNQPDLTGTADIAEEALVSGMLQISNLNINPGKLLEYLRDRAGILLSRGIKVYTFPHRTFQEYLAACYLIDKDFPEHVSTLVKKDLNRWREVTLLAASKAVRGSESSVWILADELCYKNIDSYDLTLEEINGVFIAAQALIENARLEIISKSNYEKLNRVRHGLTYFMQGAQLPAMERTNAGNLLAKLFDVRKEIMTIEDMMFCFVRGSDFIMGGDKQKDQFSFDNEMPLHNVYLSSYYISRYPVSNSQYRYFVEDGGYRNPEYWKEAIEDGKWKNGKYDGHNQAGLNGYPFDLPNHPVVSISWYEATAFTRWLTEKSHKQNLLSGDIIIRLPTEAEWEKASRGGLQRPDKAQIKRLAENIFVSMNIQMVANENNTRVYPWGDEFDNDKLNFGTAGINATSAIGCYQSGKSVYGCEEMSGNVWEWCQDWHGKYLNINEINPSGQLSGTERIIRGGAWNTKGRYCRSSGRGFRKPSSRSNDCGFRLILSNLPETKKKVQIKRLKISNIKCFDDLEILFQSSENTTLLLGTNGKGKSTILQLLAIGLCMINRVELLYNWKKVVKSGKKEGVFEIELLIVSHNDDPKIIKLKYVIDENDIIKCINGEKQFNEIINYFIVLGYGVSRHIKLEDPPPFEKIENVATLFGENGFIKHIKISKNFKYIQENFYLIQQLINSVLYESDLAEKLLMQDYSPDSFYFSTTYSPDELIPLEALSEGFKSTFTWLLDMIIRLIEWGCDISDPQDITGIVLLDEIDLHLHPAWQRTFLPSLEKVFPKIQFIATTHSPFVVQTAINKNLVILETDKSSDNIIVHEKVMNSELSYSAIVREIFDIHSPFTYETEKDFAEFRNFRDTILNNKDIDEQKFKNIVLKIAGRGLETESMMRREIKQLERQTGKKLVSYE
jgi:formylglycine-generating enzyme required for sulfatase activity/predicted ATP-binding protein involved in virulence